MVIKIIFRKITFSIALLLFAISLLAQNVGIGTPLPDYKLDVNGTVGVNDTIYHNDDADTWMAFPGEDQWEVTTGGRKLLQADGLTQQIIVNPDANGTGFIILADGVDHLIKADPVSKTIGIGTATPAYLLDVAGDFRIMGDAVDHLFYVNTAQNRVGVGTNAPAYLVDISGDFRIMGDGVDHLFYAESSTGRVGIGTANPAYKLDVNGGLRVQGLTANDVFIVDEVNERVGINNSNPNSAFDVSGEITTSELKVGTNPLPWLGNVQVGKKDILVTYISGVVPPITVNFPQPFSSEPNVLISVTNISVDSNRIWVSSVRQATSTKATINVENYGTGNPLDSLRLTWIAWE